MELIADILLVAGALGAGLYCFVLSRRLKQFTNLEQGVGGAVAVLSSQADELKKSLDSARTASDQSGLVLEALTQRAESVAQRLELMMASMHDVIPAEEPANDIKVEDPKPQEPKAEEPTTDPEPEEVPIEAVEKSEDPAAPKFEDTQEKRPGGLMFFRHDRNSEEAAT
ncbi:hypothetical protein [Ruegeria faecimaris]|uniref:Uncharacterized protein n=1 Tax=Ruegeria faecimaris TaxID=686389 RepID=A0A521EC13_9RHOB|nr:hypothetical protein [Ruegeria faecimaris]SMO81484.1 hypothetical protein SAMN06265380_110100 [Ruegeria faecimaris]